MKVLLSLTLPFLIFVFHSSCCNAQFQLEHAFAIGGEGFEFGECQVDASNNIIADGIFYFGTTDFDPGPNEYKLTPEGQADTYFAKYDAAGNFIWAKSIGGPGFDAGAVQLGMGNEIYVCGSFDDTADFDPGPAEYNLIPSGEDGFFAKYDSNGNFIWVKRLDVAIGSSTSNPIDGSIYLTGSFAGTIDFDPGSGVENLDAGNYAAKFIAKYDSGGNFVWAKALKATTPSSIANFSKVTLDQGGNIYLAGNFYGSFDFDPSNSVVNLTAASSASDMFVAKYEDGSGNLIWAMRRGSTGDDKATDVTVSSSGDVYLTGNFEGTVDFDPGNTFKLTSTFDIVDGSSGDMFLAKYTSAGAFVWAFQIKQIIPSYSEPHIIGDPNGNLLLFGDFTGSLVFDPSSDQVINTSFDVSTADVFTTTYDANGSYLAGESFGYVYDDKPLSARFDPSGTLYLSGYFLYQTDLNPNVQGDFLYGAGNVDAFIAKYSMITGVNEVASENNVLAFPNPALNTLNLKVPLHSGSWKVEIINALGQIEKSEIVSGESVSLDISNLSNGLFVIKIDGWNGKFLKL